MSKSLTLSNDTPEPPAMGSGNVLDVPAPLGMMLLRIRNIFSRSAAETRRLVALLWLFTKDDFDTFVLPNTTFGVVAALTEARCSNVAGAAGGSHVDFVLARIPRTLVFNWANLLIFDLANQRLPDSIAEDRLNKPWRPLPRALVTPRAVARAMLAAVPLVLAASHATTGTGSEAALLMVLTWMYNDLHGGDEHWLLRNAIIAAAFYLYNLGSAKAAGGPRLPPGPVTLRWAAVVSAVILTTMHVQDLKDQAGDRVHGRRTAPLMFGDRLARWTIAVPVAVWSVACTIGARPGVGYAGLLLGLGAVVAWRCVYLRAPVEDRRTWKIWCIWCAILYSLPLFEKGSVLCGRTGRQV